MVVGGVRGTGEQGSQIVCERYDGREPLSVRGSETARKQKKKKKKKKELNSENV